MLKKTLSKLCYGIVLLSIFVTTDRSSAELVTENGVDLRPLMFPVKSQAGSGACAFFALAAAMESYPGIPKLSEAHPYINYLIKNNQGKTDIEDGINLETMYQLIKNHQLIFINESNKNSFEHLFFNIVPKTKKEFKGASKIDILKKAFEDDDFIDNPIKTIKTIPPKEGEEFSTIFESYKFGEYIPEEPFYFGKDQLSGLLIQSLLRQKKPIIVSLKIKSAEWNSSYSNTNIMIDTPKKRLGEIGFNPEYAKPFYTTSKNNHAILLVGYKTIKTKNGYRTEYIFRNSWGRDWGELGYGFITEKNLIKNTDSILTFNNVLASRGGPKNITSYRERYIIEDWIGVKTIKEIPNNNIYYNHDYDIKVNLIESTEGRKKIYLSLVSYYNSVVPLTVKVQTNNKEHHLKFHTGSLVFENPFYYKEYQQNQEETFEFMKSEFTEINLDENDLNVLGKSKANHIDINSILFKLSNFEGYHKRYERSNNPSDPTDMDFFEGDKTFIDLNLIHTQSFQ